MASNLYAESSAVLAWLLGEPAGEAVRAHLRDAAIVVSSSLTLVECDRALRRAVATGRLAAAVADERRALLESAAASWHRMALDDDVLERARRPFPDEPVRSLDALHLGSAQLAAAAVPGLAVLSLDDRVRRNARALGFAVVPEGAAAAAGQAPED